MAWVFSCKFAAYFQNPFSTNTSEWLLLKGGSSFYIRKKQKVETFWLWLLPIQNRNTSLRTDRKKFLKNLITSHSKFCDYLHCINEILKRFDLCYTLKCQKSFSLWLCVTLTTLQHCFVTSLQHLYKLN